MFPWLLMDMYSWFVYPIALKYPSLNIKLIILSLNIKFITFKRQHLWQLIIWPLGQITMVTSHFMFLYNLTKGLLLIGILQLYSKFVTYKSESWKRKHNQARPAPVEPHYSILCFFRHELILREQVIWLFNLLLRDAHRGWILCGFGIEICHLIASSIL